MKVCLLWSLPSCRLLFLWGRKEKGHGPVRGKASLLGIIIAGTLTIIGVISRGEATLAVGRILLVLMLAAMAVCILRQPVLAGLTTLASFLKAVFLWLVVTVLVMALVMLGVGYLLSRCKARLSGNHDHDGGESLK